MRVMFVNHAAMNPSGLASQKPVQDLSYSGCGVWRTGVPGRRALRRPIGVIRIGVSRC